MKICSHSFIVGLAGTALLASVSSSNSTTVLPFALVAGPNDGLTAGGYMVLNGAAMTVTNATMKNFRAVGGNGSGGGAGLGGAIFVGANSFLTVHESNFLNNWAIGGNGGATLAGLQVKSGGGLNAGGLGGALLVGAPGLPGLPGTTPVDFDSLMGDGNGNGLDGSAGKAGGAALGPLFGQGGAGGSGGIGQTGWSTNPKLIGAVTKAELDVAAASLNVATLTAEIAGFTAAAPMTAGATAAAAAALLTSAADAGVQLGKAVVGLTEAQADLAQWQAANALGTVGVGGDGGMGGSGGAALFGSSGGQGGNGGMGGLGGGGAPKGNGGAGGRGGVSGFGAGGASGGDGGTGTVDGLPGMGGIAGFGGGSGSTGVGVGMPDPTGGGGGSGLGGAIFIQEGGNVLITGNTVFSGNGFLAGGSFNRGSAGDSAGSAIFLQGEAKVVLDPGLTKTITFQGRNSIADSSSVKSYAGAEAAQLAGGSVEINSGLVVFSQGTTNTYSGVTKVGGGLGPGPGVPGLLAARLRADDGDGLPQGSLLQLQNGGVIETKGAFNRYVGSMPGQIRWAGSGGFAAVGGDLKVTLDGGLPLEWGSSNLTPFLSSLVLGSITATNNVTFTNDINVGLGESVWVKGVSTIGLLSGVGDNSNRGILSGSITGLGGLTINDPFDAGVIELTNVNAYLGHTNILGGQLKLTGLGSIATSLQVNIVNPLASLDLSESSLPAQSIVGLTGFGKVLLGEKDLLISLPQLAVFGGSIEGSGSVAIGAGSQSFGGVNSYTGKTSIGPLANLSLIGDGSISASSGLDITGLGRFDIALTNSGASIKSLEGSGFVELGSKPLTISSATGTFSGVMSGAGSLNITGGIQTLSGVNTFTGKTIISGGATLSLSDVGEIASSSEVVGDGVFSIEAATGGASIKTLSGAGAVTLGDRTLTVSDGSTTFAGVIGGVGNFTVSGGTQTLSGANTFTGVTTVNSSAKLALTAGGSIAQSAEVRADGVFDISAADGDSSIVKLTGAGEVTLGVRTLTVTSADNGFFSGAISGSGGFKIASGTQILSGTNTFTGATEVAAGATLNLADTGSIAQSSLVDVKTGATFDISSTTLGASITTLTGGGFVNVGSRDLSVTAGSTTFSGALSGAGDAIVSGGTQTFSGTTITSGLVAKDSGVIVLSGGSVSPPDTKPAVRLVNGGTVTATGTTITSQNGPTISALFDTAGREANITLGAGTTVLPNNGQLLFVSRAGAGADGKVNLIIDNGQANTGSILDPSAAAGGATNVTVRSGSGYTGLVDVGNFDIAAGASVSFANGSRVTGNLTAEQGANLFGGTLSGALQVTGNVTVNNGAVTGSAFLQGNLDLIGYLSPGASPGAIAVGGNYNFTSGPSALFEVSYGVSNPVGGVNYDQMNISGNISGITPISLQGWGTTRANNLTDLNKVELVRVGGDLNGDFRLAHRVTQHGHEILLDRRERAPDPTAIVPTTSITESDFFGAGPLSVYGLRSIIQDETYALGVVASATNDATREILGTLSDRRSFGELTGPEKGWARVGATKLTVHDRVWRSQNLSFFQGGLDVISNGDLRFGVLGSYASSDGRVLTATGRNRLDGEMWSGGVYATYSSGRGYVDAVAQYGGNSWSFSPTAASGMKVDGNTTTASLEAGYTFKFDALSLTPWARMTYMATSFGNPRSSWLDNATFHNSNSAPFQIGLRSMLVSGPVSGHLNLSISHDPNARKYVQVDGFRFDTDSAATRAEGAVSIRTKVSNSTTIFGDATAAYGIGSEMRSVGGRVGMRMDW